MTAEAADAPAGRTFRLATWNMNHWQTPVERRAEAWEWLGSGDGLDVALLQETVPPASLARNRVVYHEIAGRRPWGSAAVARGSDLRTLREPRASPGWLARTRRAAQLGARLPMRQGRELRTYPDLEGDRSRPPVRFRWPPRPGPLA